MADMLRSLLCLSNYLFINVIISFTATFPVVKL